VTTLCSAGDPHILPLVLYAAARFQPLNERERTELLAGVERFASPFVGRMA